jgi:hypothetical protein
MSVRQFLIDNKWWWIVPVLLVVALVGFIVWRNMHGGSGAGADSPFQYDLY